MCWRVYGGWLVVDGRENGKNRVPWLSLSIREMLQLSEQLLFIRWPNDILEIHPREGKRRPYGSGLWLGPDLGGKVEPTRLGKRGAMTYVGAVVLAALHHWANATPRGDERAASLNMTVQSKKILNVPTAHVPS
jgi:hypothetical protein